ncbi:MAG TPA: hypothetical protein VG166_14280 [Caulobacteraceae bacterium]|nr:hypothetical protein [Caulobacteraceae bacterium]
MAAISWSKDIDGSFDTAAKWSTNAVPGATDTVTLGHLTKSYTVTVNGGGSHAVTSIEVDKSATLDISGATLHATNETGAVSKGNIIVGPLSGSVLSFGGTLDIYRLRVTGGTLQAEGTGGTMDSFIGETDNAKITATTLAATMTNEARILGKDNLTLSAVALTNKLGALITNQKTAAMNVKVNGGASLTNAGRLWARGSAGGMTVTGALTNDGILVVSGATLTVTGAVTGTGVAHIIDGVMSFGSSFDENVRFHKATPGGELILAQSQTYHSKIYNFAAGSGEKLDLKDIGFVSAGEATYANGILTVTDGSHTATIELAGNHNGVTFTAASDGSGGTIITASTTAASSLASAMAAMAPTASVAHFVAPAALAQTSLVSMGR